VYDLGIDNVIIVSGNFDWRPFVGSVCVRDGRITEVRRTGIAEGDCRERIDGKGKILMPGLFNCHCHGDMTLARGFGDDLTLAEQIAAFGPHNWFRDFITDEDRYYARQLTYCEALLGGCTFICENMYWGLGERSVQAMTEIGIRGALVEDIRTDFADRDSLLSDKALKEFAEGCRRAGLVPVIGLPAEEDWEAESLRRMFDRLADIDTLQTMHLAENLWRKEIVLNKFDRRPVEFLSKNGFLHDRLIASHVVFVDGDEIGMLAEDGVKVANTPVSEMKIADGIAPIQEMLRRGIPVGLGTDGAMWNNSNDILAEIKEMSLLHTVNGGIRSLSKKALLDMATIKGAELFGLQDRTGSIREGFRADFILIDGNKPHLQPLVLGENENICSALVYGASAGDVSDVFIEGKHLVREGIIANVDISVIVERVRETTERIAGKVRHPDGRQHQRSVT